MDQMMTNGIIDAVAKLNPGVALFIEEM